MVHAWTTRPDFLHEQTAKMDGTREISRRVALVSAGPPKPAGRADTAHEFKKATVSLPTGMRRAFGCGVCGG